MTATAEVPPQRIPPYFKQNQDHLKDFYSKCHQLSMKILRSFALGLKLEDYKFFDDSNQKDLKSGTTMRLLHYPPIQNATEELVNKKIIRCGA
jgi:isopenicillin N synthase-like dioxygenase